MRLQGFPILIISGIASYVPLREVVILAQESDTLHYTYEIQLRKIHQKVQLSSLEDCCYGFQMLLWTLRWPPLGQHVRLIEMNIPWASWASECYNIPRPSKTRPLSGTDITLLENTIRRAGFDKTDYDNIWLQISTIPEDASTACWTSMGFTRSEKHNRVIAWSQALAPILISVSPNLESLAVTPASWGRCGTPELGYTLRAISSSFGSASRELLCSNLTEFTPHQKAFLSSYPHLCW